jgi:hypothetical protein
MYTWSIHEKHLDGRRRRKKKEQEIPETKHLGSYKRSCPSIRVKQKNDSSFANIVSWCSKPLSFLSLQRHHKKQEGTIFNTTALLSSTTSLPTSKQVGYSTRHHPRQPKTTKKGIP